MKTYPVPFNEDARVAAIKSVPGLTRDNDIIFDTICAAAAKLLESPIAHISVVEENTQWYKSVVGVDLEEMSKNNSFCTHTIMSGKPMIVSDLSADPKFRDHPMVAEGGPKVRYYAGVPLILSSGYRFGSLCVLDFVPHEMPSQKEIAVLEDLGRAVVAALEKAPAKAAGEISDSQDAFLMLVGHELRSPLTIIHGSLRMLEARLNDKLNKKLSKSAVKSSEHLSKLISAILNFSDARTGELKLNEEATEMDVLIEEIYDDHFAAIQEAGKVFAMPKCSVRSPILVDQQHIKVCMVSLLMNAIVHGGDTIDLVVDINADGNVEIRVSDDGIFDDKVDLSQIYLPFSVGGDISNRGTGGGLGLGLPLTRRLVELHGGELEVTTGSQGTVACIRLPKWRISV